MCMGQRARILGSSLLLAIFWQVCERLLDATAMVDPWSLRGAATLLGRTLGILLGASFLLGLRGAWFGWLRARFVAVIDALWAWRGQGSDREAAQQPSAELVHYAALGAGLMVAALDIMLTALLLRDVFPEPPYAMPELFFAAPRASEWFFYVAVASLKTGLALWFGLREGSGPQGAVQMRFALGAASAFDALLAVARGVALAEQGLGGAPIMVSNLVFAGFGIAVPWVVAYTGRMLGIIIDRGVAQGGSWLRLWVIWGLAVFIGLPVGIAILGVATLLALWQAVDDVVAVVFGMGRRRRFESDDALQEHG